MSDSTTILDLPPPPAARRVRYGAGAFHFGDLYLPAGGAPFPLLMNIHGGFWRARYSLEHAGHLCAALAEAGIAVWNIEYRRVGNPGGGWTGTFEDIAQAADFIPALAREIPIDLARVGVMGHSAGGHLALWAAARPAFPPSHLLYNDEAFRFAGAVALAPVADVRRAWELNLSDDAADDLLGGAPTTYAERYAQASPVELPPPEIPIYLLHGAQDGIVPLDLSERYAHTMREDTTLIRLENAGHFELIDPRSSAWGAVLRAAQAVLRLPVSGANPTAQPFEG